MAAHADQGAQHREKHGDRCEEVLDYRFCWHYLHYHRLRSPVQAHHPEEEAQNSSEQPKEGLGDVLENLPGLYFYPLPEAPLLEDDLQHLAGRVYGRFYLTEEGHYLVSAEHLLVHYKNLHLLQVGLGELLQPLVFGDLQVAQKLFYQHFFLDGLARPRNVGGVQDKPM